MRGLTLAAEVPWDLQIEVEEKASCEGLRVLLSLMD